MKIKALFIIITLLILISYITEICSAKSNLDSQKSNYLDQSISIDFISLNVPQEFRTPITNVIINKPDQILRGNNFVIASLSITDNWGLATIAIKDTQVDGVGMGDNGAMIILWQGIDGIWQAFLEGTKDFIKIIPEVPENVLGNGFKSTIKTNSADRLLYLSLLFPWNSGQNWQLTYGWHYDNDTRGGNALDFAPLHSETNKWVLAAHNGTITRKCDVGTHSVNLRIQNGDTFTEYWHLDKNSIPGYIQNGKDVPQGAIIGWAYNGAINPFDGCGISTGSHVHFVLPAHDVNIDGWEVNDSNVWTKGTETKYENEFFGSSNIRTTIQWKHIENAKPWSWKYQIGSDDQRIRKYLIDDIPFIELPGCSWGTKTLLPGSHTLTYWVQIISNLAPTPEIQPWPYVKYSCASDDGDDPIEPPGYLVPDASFTGYETLSDGTVVSPGQSLTKTWRFKNTGSTTWGSGYKLAFIDAEQMGAPTSVDVPTTAPGETVDISVPMVAPAGVGDHIGKWRLRNPQGTYFGDTVWVKISVLSANSGSNITMFDVSPASPSSASTVHVIGRARYFTDLRSMRFVIGNEVHEMSNFIQVGDQNEISFDWDTSSLARGDYAIVFEVAKNGDADWVNAERQIKVYTLTGTPVSNNHPPDRPLLKSPYNWYLKDASGSPASVELCVYPANDPDGDSVQYYFEVKDQGGGVYANSGWVSSACWSRSYDPTTYSWRVKTGNNNGTVTSDWSTDTWNFTVAKGGVYIGDLNFFQTQTNETHICVMVTYDGIQAPDVYAWLNKANDGSETGEWRLLDHYGPNTTPDCTQANYHGFWIHSPEYTTGNHKLRISAVKKDSGANQTKETYYNINYIRPSDVKILAPSTSSNNGTWWNSRTLDFTWSPSLRAENYTLRVSTNSNPWSDSSPILNQVFGSGTTSSSHTFSQDYAKLYWSVKASNSAGETDSGADIWFGIDTIKPGCEVEALSSPSYENVFRVGWSGTDDAAGIRSFDVQYIDTTRDTWKDWLLAAPASKPYELFNGQPGHTYYFRCRATDNAGNTGDYPTQYDTSMKIDPASRPNEPWWDANYGYKRNLVIQNNMAGLDLPAGYPVHLQFNSSTTPTAQEIYNLSLSSKKCDDVRIVFQNGTDLNRVVQNCKTDSIDMWFRTQSNISQGLSDSTNYQLYYSNPNPENLLNDPNKVWYPYKESDTQYLLFFQEGSGSTTTDYSDYGRNCSLDPSVSWSQSKFGYGLRFERTTNTYSVTCGSSSMSSFTIEFWYKSDNDDEGKITGQVKPGVGPNWMLLNMGGRIRLDAWPCSTCGGINVQSNFNVRDTPYAGKWNHIAVSFNGGNEVRFYINGIRDSIKYLEHSGITQYNIPLEIGSVETTDHIKANIGAYRISSGVKEDFFYGQFANITSEPSIIASQAQVPPSTGSSDLEVLGLSAYPNSEGGILVQAIVQNQGDKETLNGFFTDVYVDHLPTGAEDYSGSIQFWVNDPIAVGQIITLTTVVENTVVLRTTTNSINAYDDITGVMYAQTDSTGAVPEIDNQNNIYSEGATFCLASADAYESDSEISSASLINSGEMQTHNFGGPDDQDWLKFSAEKDKPYIFQTFDLGTSADTYLYLYDTDGTTLLASNDDYGGSLASRIDWIAPTTSTYYLLVKHWNPNAGGCGNGYSIAIDWIKYFLPVILR